MAYEKKPGDISIFKNDRKEKDTHPDYRIVGLDLNGDKIKGALWLKTDRNGNKFMAGKIEPDLPRDDFRSGDAGSVPRSGGGGSHTQSGGRDNRQTDRYDLNDDIPF
jgi:hypothetical protein